MSYAAFESEIAKVNDILCAVNLLTWDSRVMMPPGGVDARGKQIATLVGLARDLATGDGMQRTIEGARAELSGLAPGDIRVLAVEQAAGAIATLGSRWSLLAARTGADLPPVFDEQVRHIGRTWRATGADGLARALGNGGNAGMVDGRLLVLGVTLNRMVFNAELFEKCAKAYVLAQASGHAVGRIPWWVRAVAGRRLRADERRAAADHVAGRETPELQAY